MTSFRLDQVASMAQTLTSTKPIGSTTSRITFSVRSVRTPLVRLGQATQIIPSGAIAERRVGSRRASSARRVANTTIVSR